MNSKIIQRRIRSIRHLLNKKKIASLIVTRPANITYTTGFSGDDSWAVITQRNVYLLTDSRYTEQAKKQCRSCRVIERTDSMAEETARLLSKIKPAEKTAIEKSVSIAVFEALKKNIKHRIQTTANIIESVRNIKGADEIAAIGKACQIAEKALRQVIRFAKAGITENQLAGRLDFEIRKLNAVSSFETIVAFGANASQPHHKPAGRKLKKNDTVLIDFGVRYKGYCCDLTRCFTVGKVNSFYKRVYEVVKQAQAAALKMIKAGADVKKIDASARKVIRKYGLPVYGHGTGHGLGLEVHESPVISDNAKGKLQQGMVFTIEPAVYIPGKLGIRIEDDVLVTEDGYRILSQNRLAGPFPHA